MPLTKYDYMIKALASDRADQSFRIAVLPRRSRLCRSVANAHRANAPNECLAVDAVAITNEVLRRALPTESLRDLLGDPFGSRVGRNVLQPCDGGRLRRAMYLATEVWPTSMPSLSSSPWMRGAPQRGLAKL